MSARSAIVLLLGIATTIAGCDKPASDNGQAAANQTAAQVSTPSADEAPPSTAPAAKAGAVDRSHKGEAAPAAAFANAAGKPLTVKAFGGKPTLVNLWATWCAPCVKEMPTLDAAAKATSGRIRVVAVSEDMDPKKARAFFADRHLSAIEPMYDPQLGLSLALNANLPTTILYDKRGREVWRVIGERDWASAESRALLNEV
ncbi:Thiol-disulfide isomerase or thioredoxin [Sphingomonas palmae]|uniref:Thiol-disulfide isomerase or thioredoxin n=1 Tax=Sphingomonas palmae TaxID=1855283 RepID=A0A1H7RLU8_9SPHN|nr:TlpA disulfide reductase family protein [Sphingomonas palmae]SEL61029.1 Thiol-disulfide isomerase or thioredoxin [Sphingomonas palmae]